jgi:hypothetical protein
MRRFLCTFESTRKLKINGVPLVTVIGKAFWDIAILRKMDPIGERD